MAENKGISFYFLGGKEGVNRRAVDNVIRKYPKLNIAGRHHGYFTVIDEEEVLEDINNSGADVVWVALGRPKQEEWCMMNKSRLRTVTWLKTCGGLFDFLSGDVTRAPNWMQIIGLEWLYRMIQEPKRLFVRYFFTNLHAIYCYLFKSEGR